MPTHDRLHALDAVRAFALLLGVAFHAGFSFLPGLPPGIWAINDNSPSTSIAIFLFVAHIFRMSLFFFVAGFFARMLFQRGGARGFWTNRLKRILLPLIAGWVVIFPALAVIWIWGLTKTFGGTLPPAPANLPPAPPLAFPLTHLWFLYYLLVLYAALLLGRRIILAIDRSGWLRRTADTAVRLSVRSAVAAVALALPLTLALYFRETWFAWFGVPTPDQSLMPEVASLVGFGTAIAFGWLVHRQRDLLEVWARQWPLHAGAAAIATAACLWMAGPTPVFVPTPPGLTKLALAFAYSTAIWCWGFAAIGLADARSVAGERQDQVHRRCLVLDLCRAHAGRGGAASRRRTSAPALECQVPADPDRQLRPALRELPVSGAIDVHRAIPERTAIPAHRRTPGARRRSLG